MRSPFIELFKTAKRRSSAAYTLIELGMVIAVIGLLATYAIFTFGDSQERRDATMIQSAQASLQGIVSQGATRFDIRPQDLPANIAGRNAVITAINGNLGNTGGNNVSFSAGAYPFRLNINNSGSWATFRVQTNGDVVLDAISSNLTLKGYSIQNGVLVKN